jgi:hypothetical protein
VRKLAYLFRAEIAHKDQRRIQMGLSIAKFSFVRTLEGFDTEAASNSPGDGHCARPG